MVKPLPVAHLHDFTLEIFHSGVGAAVLAALPCVGWSVHVGPVSYTHLDVYKRQVPMKGATSIQERLWELRKDKGLNLEELSKLTGISKSALGSYEKEDFKEINHGNLITLADFYGVSRSGSGF